MRFAIYNLYTGQIDQMTECPLDMISAQLAPHQGAVVAGPDVENVDHCVSDTGEVMLKQDYTLEALPLPCTVTIEGIAYEVTEQPTFEFDSPGSFTLKVDAGPRYLQKEFVIENQTLLT